MEQMASGVIDRLSFNGGVIHASLNANLDNLRRCRAKGSGKNVQEPHIGQRPRTRSWVVASIGDGSWERVDARGWHCFACKASEQARVPDQLGARPRRSATQHVPDDQAVHTFPTCHDFCREACVDARPCIVSGIGPRVLAQRPNDELVSILRALEDVRVVAVEAAFRFDTAHAPIVESDLVVMPLSTPDVGVVLNQCAGLQESESRVDEGVLGGSACGSLATQTLHCAGKQAGFHKRNWVKAVASDAWRGDLQSFRIRLDLLRPVFALVAGDDGGCRQNCSSFSALLTALAAMIRRN